MNHSILYLDAAARPESRTRSLADYVAGKLCGTVERVSLYDEAFAPMDAARLQQRMACCKMRDYSGEEFRLARQLAAAETIIIAAPYWDMSFPSVLKEYLQWVSVSGLTFRYTPEGQPQGLCRAKTLYYVTTAGGELVPTYGFGYVEHLAGVMFGIPKLVLFSAERLDLVGADVPAILNEARERIDRYFIQNPCG